MIARTDQYRFLSYGPDGTLTRVVTLAREPRSIQDEDRSVFMECWEEFLRENNVPGDRRAEIKSSIGFGNAYPAYAWFEIGPAGTLLVQRVRPVTDLDAEERKDLNRSQEFVPPGDSQWDVFDMEGRYLGAVAIPGSEWVSPPPFLALLPGRRDRHVVHVLDLVG